MRNVLALSLVPLLIQGLTACDDEETGGSEPDADTDTDTDVDSDTDTDADTDADTDTDIEVELRLDDGTCEMTNGPGDDTVPGGMIANCFTPPSYPAPLCSARFFVGDLGQPTTTFGVRVFVADGTDGSPGTELEAGEITGAATGAFSWAVVDLAAADLAVESGDFCVAMEWLTPYGKDLYHPPSQTLCSDNDLPPQHHTWIRWADTGWYAIETIGVEIATDAMIRVTVSVPSAD